MKKYLLLGYSMAPKYNYIPHSYEKLNKQLGKIKGKENRGTTYTLSYKERDLAEQIIDCYGKIGFLFIARDYIQQENSRRNYTHDIHYHLYNFIYATKAFLDAVSVLLNEKYSLGRSKGEIDLKHSFFRKKIIKKEPLLENILQEKEKWILDVVEWRESVIHKFSTPLGYSIDPESGKTNGLPIGKHPLMMLKEPKPYLFSKHEELEKKYGSA